jgi:PRTRC genetic system protein B
MLGVNTESIALLLHRNDKSGTVEVTSHKIVPAPEAGFTLGAGRLFNQQDKTAIVEILSGNKESLAFVPDHVLARDGAGFNMVWFTPPRQAEVHFRNAEYRVPLPLLIYAKFEGQPLRVFAAKGRTRPTPDTQLWIAPLGNINTNGTMCGGNVRQEEFRGRDEDRAACEGFAVEARATHLGDTPPLKGVATQEAYQAFMAKLHAEPPRTFPANRLLPAKARTGEQYRLADLIRAGGRP